MPARWDCPYALKIREVVPMRDAARVIKFTRSKRKKDARINPAEPPPHKVNSLLKIGVSFFISPPKT